MNNLIHDEERKEFYQRPYVARDRKIIEYRITGHVNYNEAENEEGYETVEIDEIVEVDELGAGAAFDKFFAENEMFDSWFMLKSCDPETRGKVSASFIDTTDEERWLYVDLVTDARITPVEITICSYGLGMWADDEDTIDELQDGIVKAVRDRYPDTKVLAARDDGRGHTITFADNYDHDHERAFVDQIINEISVAYLEAWE